jgi:hypothetical protein
MSGDLTPELQELLKTADDEGILQKAHQPHTGPCRCIKIEPKFPAQTTTPERKDQWQ